MSDDHDAGELSGSATGDGRPIPQASVGVVIPAHACAEFLPATLDSLLAQTFGDWQAVVVDDGSPDEVAAIAADYVWHDARLTVIRQANAGVSVARNRGAGLLQSVEWLLFCDGDDVLLPNALEDLVGAMRAAPGAAAVHGLSAIIDREGRRTGDLGFTESQRYHFDVDGRSHLNVGRLGLLQLARQCTIGPPAAVLVDAEAFSRSEGFDPAFSSAADWDLWLRLARLGGIATLDREVVLYRKHDRNMTVVGNAAGHREVRRVRVKTYRSPDNSATDRKMLRRLDRQHHLGRVRTSSRRSERGGTLRDIGARVVHLALAAYGRPIAR